jgi:class 3 adenylate cyclase
VARWLETEGFSRVSILEGGLRAWRRAGLATVEVEDGERLNPAPALAVEESAAVSALPMLADRYLGGAVRAERRRLTTLFVDIAGSTRLLVQHPPEEVLAVVQRFMRLVTDVAIAYCGDVKDFEGDGALLYFESPREATQAALAIRAALASGACRTECPVTARMSLTVGEVVVGVVGSPMRQALALVGPSVNIGARLLKQVAPGGIIASAEVVDQLAAEAPELAADWVLHDRAFEVPGGDGITVTTYIKP